MKSGRLSNSGNISDAALIQENRAARSTTAAPPIARKRGSLGIWARRATVQAAGTPPCGVTLACDLARSGSKPGAAFFQVEMRQPVYDGCAADRTQAQALEPYGVPHRIIPGPCNQAGAHGVGDDVSRHGL